MTKTVLITGATSGLGYALAKLYEQMGYQLILIARNTEKLKIMQKELTSQVFIFSCDLTKKEEYTSLCNQLIKENHIPDILINNAGMGGFGPFDERHFEDEYQLINLNITALTYFCNYLTPHMKKKTTQTYIMNIASAAAFAPGPYQASYYASKAYVLSYSQAIHQELKKTNISVTCLCPGKFASKFHQSAGIDIKKGAISSAHIAQMAHKALINKRSVCIVPFRMKIIAGILPRLLPVSLIALYTQYRSKKMINDNKKQ